MGESSLKFQQMGLLQKYLQSNKEIPRSYLVLHSQREERRKLLETLSETVIAKKTKASSHFWEAEEKEWDFLYENLMTPSLFGEEEVLIWNGVKGLSERALESLISYVLSPSPHAVLLIGVDSVKAIPDLYQKTKQSLVFLDFSEEKPWDRQKRIEQETLLTVQKAGKKFTGNALHQFLTCVGTDSLGLEGELSKLLTYVGDRLEIREGDILAISSSLDTATGWQLSESLVWGDPLPYPSSLTDLSFLLGLLGQVRFYLQQGRQIGWYLQKKASPDEICKAMPSLRPVQLKKVTAALFSRRMAYFEEALDVVYEVELLAKNSNLSSKFLFDLLQTKMMKIKQTHTRS